MNCSKTGCTRRRFMDTDRCIDHQRHPGFTAWFIFVVGITLAMLGLGAWALIEIVTWITSK